MTVSKRPGTRGDIREDGLDDARRVRDDVPGISKRREEIVEEREPRRPPRGTDALQPAGVWNASPFVLQRRLKEIEARQVENSELVAHVFLIVQQIRDRLDAAEHAGRGLRLPGPTAPGPDRRFSRFERLVLGFFFPWVLRRGDTDGIDQLP